MVVEETGRQSEYVAGGVPTLSGAVRLALSISQQRPIPEPLFSPCRFPSLSPFLCLCVCVCVCLRKLAAVTSAVWKKRVPSTRTKAKDGLGIGLYACAAS